MYNNLITHPLSHLQSITMSSDERNDVEDHDLGSVKELASLFSS